MYCSPTIIRDGYKLSYNALSSRKKFGEKIKLSVSNISRTFSVYPTGTVDLMTIVASGLIDKTLGIKSSTERVLKVI